MRKFWHALLELNWTASATGLVLITLDGRTARLGWWLAISSLVLWLLGVLLPLDDD